MIRLPIIKKLAYWDRIIACFMAGVLAGTAAANLLSGQLTDRIGYPGEVLFYAPPLGETQRRELFGYVCRQRLLEVLFGWLVSLTVFSSPCFCLMAAFAGTGVGLALSISTFQKGLMGLPCYLAAGFPQLLVYFPIWLALAMWAGERPGKTRIPAAMLLLALTVAGAFLETFVNPYFARFLIF